MPGEQPPTTRQEPIAEAAEEMAEAIDEVQEQSEERKRRLRAEIDAENRRLDEAIHEGNEILKGERE